MALGLLRKPHALLWSQLQKLRELISRAFQEHLMSTDYGPGTMLLLGI